MQTRISKLSRIVVGTALLSMAFALPAAAHEHYGRWHRVHHHYYSRAYDRPLTVSKYRNREYAAPDPFRGPAAIITGPVAVAATIVSLPFRVAGAVFPPYGNPAVNPLVIVGAPVHAAGQVAEFPFYVVGSAFGAPPPVVY